MSAVGIVVTASHAKLHITNLDVSDHAIMRARQLWAMQAPSVVGLCISIRFIRGVKNGARTRGYCF
jgi:hypothetical protein